MNDLFTTKINMTNDEHEHSALLDYIRRDLRTPQCNARQQRIPQWIIREQTDSHRAAKYNYVMKRTSKS